ncbi:MAG: cysteine desulfurase [Deltaproteobacteria bacterium CSP1-8]|nr:MAG: cysteine desulfurase [Deltaproteobacteria bacterium CSP1-8]
MAETVARALGRAGNPGRSGHALSIRSARDLFVARERLAELFGARDSSRFVFTGNATEALNQAIKGILRPGDHAVTTSVEHNSVMRPLRRMEEAGVTVTVVPAGPDGAVDAKAVAAAIRRRTRLVAVVHASNVTGAIQPARQILRAARKAGAYLLLDAAQTAGSVPLSLSDLPVDLLAAPGHKGLLGPQGTGFLYVREGVPVVPLIEGGTGSRSESDRQPDFFPDALESGTPNSVGIAGLGVSLAWLLRKGIGAVRRKERELLEELVEGMGRIGNVTVYGPRDPSRRASVISFLVDGMDPAEVGRRLEKEFGVLVRSGLHCSPDSHRTIGTFPEGTVRVSPGPFTTGKEIARFLAALRKIAASRR